MQVRLQTCLRTQITATGRCTKTFKRHIVRQSRATSVRDKDLSEELWVDWYRENKWKQTLGTRGMDDLDRSFLEQDFINPSELAVDREREENFEDFTADIIDFELNRPRSAQGDPKSRVDSEEFDVLDDDYHETMGLYQKASLKDSEVKGELAYITDLRNKLRESDQRGKEYEVVMPTGEVIDYDTFKDSLSKKSERNKFDPYKRDHRQQMIDMGGRTFGRGGAKQARATCVIVENPTGEGMTYVNGEHYVTYFPQPAWRLNAVLPLFTTATFRKYDVFAFVRLGGKSGQSQALRLALARALYLRDPSLRIHLQPYGFLDRDARSKTRKLPGFRGPRKRRPYRRR